MNNKTRILSPPKPVSGNLYYVSKSTGKRVMLKKPITIKKLENEDEMIKDKYQLINAIFGDDLSPDYSHIYDKLIDCIREDKHENWEEVADMFTDLKNPKYDIWAGHCVEVASKMKNRGHKKTKKFFIDMISDSSVRKFKKIISGG